MLMKQLTIICRIITIRKKLNKQKVSTKILGHKRITSLNLKNSIFTKYIRYRNKMLEKDLHLQYKKL